MLPLGEGGIIGGAIQNIAYEGSSIIPCKQDSPHPHSIVNDPSGKYVLVADMGTDKIHIYKLDEAGRLLEHGQSDAVPGSGPRHILFNPTRPYMYIIHELTRIDPETGTLKAVGELTLSANPICMLFVK